MKKGQKGGTSDVRNKLTNDMVSNVEKLCRKKGYNPHKTLINKYVETAIDDYIHDWYEVSLEAMDLMEGGADFVTDEEIDDPELINEAKRRVVKNMYEERPPGLHENIVASIIHSMNSDPQEADIRFNEESDSVKTPANKGNKKEPS